MLSYIGGKTLILEQGEYFKQCEIRSGSVIDNIKFTTSRGRAIQVGGGKGGYHKEGGDSKLISVRGRSGRLVDQIQLLWMDSDALKYKIVNIEFDVDKGVILNQEPEVIASLTIDNSESSGTQSQ